METKGEFEQRPEVKPAEQIPFSRPKASPLPWILCVILLIAAGGLLAWKLLDNGGNKTNCTNTANNQGTVAGGESAGDKYETIRKSKKIVSDVKSLALKYAGNEYALYDDSYWVGYEFEKGYSTQLDWDFGFRIDPNNASDYKQWKAFEERVTANAGFKNDLKTIAKKYDLAESNFKDGGFAQADSYAYFTNDDGYRCRYSTAGSFDFSCGHTSWVTEEKKKLVKDLVDAFYRDTKNERSSDEPFYLEAEVDDIVDSKNKPYQTLTAYGADAALLFYRKGEDAEWKFFAGAQALPGCAMYNTDELKTAYEGARCWTDNGESTVKK